MTTQLTPTTKELIYDKIEKAKAKVTHLTKMIDHAETSQTKMQEFVEFYQIERDLIEQEIEVLKQMLFTK